MQIADNNHNNSLNTDNNCIMQIRIPKSGNRIMQMHILLITASAFSPINCKKQSNKKYLSNPISWLKTINKIAPIYSLSDNRCNIKYVKFI
jgi:hypothetical protein